MKKIFISLLFYFFSIDLYALDITKGINVENQVWPPIFVGGKIKGKPVIIGQTLVLADEDATVHFIDIEKGIINYSFSLIDTADIFASVVEYEGFAWIVSENGELFRADPDMNDVKEVSILKRSD